MHNEKNSKKEAKKRERAALSRRVSRHHDAKENGRIFREGEQKRKKRELEGDSG